MKIAEFERASGVGRSTVHHYLNLGLLPPPERHGPKLHLYGRAHLEQIRRIRRLRRRGASLSTLRARWPDAAGARTRAERANRLESTPDFAREAHGLSTPSAVARRSSRHRILDAAAHLFTEEGYENVHVADVAERAAVGKATLYQYFKSKSDLFVACLDRLIDVTTAAQRQFMTTEGSSLLTDVERYAAAMIASYPSYRMMVSALGDAAFGRDEKLALRARSAFMALVTTLEPTLRKAMNEGRCREMDSEMLACMTWGALMAVGARVHHGDHRYTLLEGTRLYLDFVTRGTGTRRREPSR